MLWALMWNSNFKLRNFLLLDFLKSGMNNVLHPTGNPWGSWYLPFQNQKSVENWISAPYISFKVESEKVLKVRNAIIFLLFLQQKKFLSGSHTHSKSSKSTSIAHQFTYVLSYMHFFNGLAVFKIGNFQLLWNKKE